MSTAKDLTGQRFNKLTAVRPTENRASTSIIWECICDCGNTTFVAANNLRSGNTKSCGCFRKAEMGRRRAVDLAGKRFGRLIAVRSTEERRQGSVVWECLCDCGNTAYATVDNLQQGKTKSCGCLATMDITGQRFGKLTAVRPTEKRAGSNIVWECICDCGNTTFVGGSQLRRGNTKSCGCLTAALDLAGMRFGKLTAVRPTEERIRSYVVWECLCDCGKTIDVRGDRLRSGAIKSCGCADLR